MSLRGTNATEPIAIVGISARVPGAPDTSEFWKLLRDGIDSITEVPLARFDIDSLYAAAPGTPGKLASRWGGFIEDVELFDASFFGISPREAVRMDPQQRLALEAAWDALDDGGHAPLRLRGTATGVFIGAHRDEYGTLAGQAATEVDLFSATGSARSGIAGRISYALGLEGPSVVLDTDRSSSLVAVQLACQSLRGGECSLALAGGVNLVLTPDLSLGFSRAGMLAPDGRIKFCDARANGIVRSDGVGMVVLKTLREAQRDGDPIYALILGGAINHDGGRSGDLMTPSSASQAALLDAACQSAGVLPRDIQYVEAHGTGTIVGDPVEVSALAAVLQRGRAPGSALRIGSVKTNIGHTEAAGGVVGLIKVALAMKHRLLPASLHFETPNPRIAFDGIVVQRQATPWPDESKRLVAGVTSVGLTGVNAHVILAEAPRIPLGGALGEREREEREEREREIDRLPSDPSPDHAPPAAARAELLTVSARDRGALVALAGRYARRLRDDVSHPASDFAYAAATRRSHLEDRLAVVGASREELAHELEAFVQTGAAAALTRNRFGHRPRIAFVFPGHGSQWVGMGRGLLESEPAFRASMIRCDAAIQRVAGWSLLEELARDGVASRLDQFGIVQPALVALEISLAAQWQAWGIKPDVIVGTSMGEVAAAHVAGALSLEDAMLVICTRSRLVQERVAGRAAIVELPVAAASQLLRDTGRGDRAWVAGVNGPNATLLAGDAAAMEAILAEAARRGCGGRYVKGLPATHTPYVDPISDELTTALANVAPVPASVPMVSTVTANAVDGRELDGRYWVRNLREPFVFSTVVEGLLDTGCDVFLEVSPHPVVMGPILDLVAQANQQGLVLGSLRRDEPERRALLRSLGSLYASGHDVEWPRVFDRGGSFVELPSYAWQRERYWYGPPQGRSTGATRAPAGSDRDVDRDAGASIVVTRGLGSEGGRQGPTGADRTVAPAGLAAKLAGATPRERRERILEHVQGEVENVLGARSIDPRRSFRELGVTSLMNIELVTRLGSALDRALPPSVLFNYPNVVALADHLAQDHRARPASASGAELVDRGLGSGAEPGTALAREAVDPIAVVGMSCRFPGASSPEAFWRLLRGGIDAIVEVPSNRWDVERWYDPEPGQPGKARTRWGGFVEDIDEFDAAFFGISPREAEEMDPQQRLVLEVSWEALERAGLAPDQLLGSKAGVFLGIMNNNDYAARKRLQDDPSRIRAHHSTGTATSIAAGRLAYTLGLTGPAMAVDTACSSSLVAVHLAMRSLRRGECRMALAGGVNAILSPELTVAYSQAGMLSPQGRCKTFDASADGYVRSEGCGILVLKRLSDAVAGGDPVLALLTGAGVNQDGRSSGLTAPNGLAQRAVVREALADARRSPSDVDYVEAHGTGTPLGDPIELEALGEVFQEGRSADRPVLVGSVKTNIGHLEAAAGVAGLMKVILALQHREVPPHLHLAQLNPLLSTEPYPLGIPTQRTPWPAGGRGIAGVSSFGFSGTNAHIIVEQAPAAVAEPPAVERAAEILVLSAKTEEALRALAERHATDLKQHAGRALGDVAFTLAAGRAHHDHRLALVGRTRAELGAALDEAARGRTPALASRGKRSTSGGKLAWLFTGQGAQWSGMGRGLAAAWPAFATALDETCAALDVHLDRPVKDVMWAEAGTPEAGLLDQTGYTQPAMFAIAVALAALWRSWGAQPDLLAGHSIGELAAAHLAGVFSLDDAARLVAARARLMQALPAGGAMISIAAPEAEVAAAVSRHAATVSVAAVNGPAAVVISGAEAAVEQIARELAGLGLRTRRLSVSHAFHSPLMEPMLEDLRRVAQQVTYRAPDVPGVGNVSGALWGPEVATADYWVAHARQAVRFSDGVNALYEAGARTFVELGPRPTLTSMISGCLPAGEQGLSLLASLRAERAEAEVVLEALAGWYAGGASVDWSGVFPGRKRRVELPTYPWQKQRYWISPPPVQGRGGTPAQQGLLGTRVSVAGVDAVYENVLSLEAQPWLADHRVGVEAVVPAAALVELLRAASEDQLGGEAAELRSVSLSAPLRIPEHEAPEDVRSLVRSPQGKAQDRPGPGRARPEGRRVQVIVTRGPEGQSHAAVHSQPAGADEAAPWTLHAASEVHRAAVAADPRLDLDAVRARCVEQVDVEATYEALSAVGLSYGPAFRGLRAVWRGPGEALAHAVVPEGWDPAQLGVHPAILDAALQVTVAGAGELYVPFAVERMTVAAQDATEAWVHVRYTTPAGQPTLGAEVTLTDARGQVLVVLSGFRARRAELASLGLGDVARDAVFRVAWRPMDAPFAPLAPGRWVVVGATHDELAAGLCEALGARGASCVAVDWAQLGGALPAEHVVCIWDSATTDAPPQVALQQVTQGLEVVQALAGRTPAPRLWWMTRGAMRVEPDEVPAASASALWGFGRTLQQEYPELGCTLVDLPQGAPAAEAALAELAVRDDEREVAWRAGRRYAARLERAPQVARAPRALRTDGTVLVTGGLGALGQHVATWLARRGVRHLVLTGRRGADTPGLADLVAGLANLGTEVTIAALDVTDRAAVAAALAAIPEHAPLRGVVHAAGALDDGVLSEQTAERFAHVMGPKAAGAWHLDVLTRDADLDFFVMFSSVVGTMGSAGQASYGAANGFLDGLAAHRQALGLPAMSMAWGPWAEAGMAAGLDPAQHQRWVRKGLPPMSPSRGLALFEAALDHPDAHLVLAPLDLARLGQAFSGGVPPLWRALVRSPSTPIASRSDGAWAGAWIDELSALPAARHVEAVLEVVRTEVSRVLSLAGPEVVAVDRPLNELGLDSLMAMELRNVLGKRAGTSLPTTLAFDYPTPSAIAQYLVDKLGSLVSVPAAPMPAADARLGTRLEEPGRAPTSGDEPIAIVGFGCRFPGGVKDADSFWHLLSHEVDAIREVPGDRWDVDAHYDPDPGAAGKMYTREGGFLAGIDQFDADFFEISPREAVSMDPQQRLLLETSWEALDRAGISPDSLMGKNVGVFVGVMSHEYLELQANHLDRRDGYVTTGSMGSVASGRISYALGVRGPSMTIDTACSSSLVATHLACQALRAGECEMALSGGVTVVLTPSLYVEFSRLRGLSRDGRCKSFDAAADGVSWSEGCGVIALKRLRDAQRDGDRILAVIRGSAINQDGRSQGLTAPNGPAQQEVIRRALAQAQVAPADVEYLEAHGTGTKLGDPIEMQALGAVLQAGRDPAHPVVVGSLKSNIGHSQAAAGVGGIIKTLLAMQHELIPRSLHFREPSPHIPWSELPVRVASEAIAWKRQAGKPRIAGISSFGISGTNAHLVLQEAPAEQAAAAPVRAAELVVVSAKTGPALAQAAAELSAHLRAHAGLGLGEVAATLATGRAHRAHRLAIVARSRDAAMSALDAAARGEALPPGCRSEVASGSRVPLAWLFTGQGSQWSGMGRGLAAEWPVFRQALDKVARALDGHLEQPLLQVMWDSALAGSLDQTAYTQPALFALEVALAALWRSWGAHPDVLIGHSVGELAAAYVAGVFTLEDAARLVTARGRLMQALPAGGAMASIAAPEAMVVDAVAPYAAQVSIAAINGPDSVVISGAEAIVEQIAGGFASRGVRTRRLVVSHAFHSPLMEPMLEELRRVAASITYRAPSVPLISNVTGARVGEAVMTADYWVDHVRGAVRFATGMKAVREAGARVLLELGPRPTLLGLVPACLPDEDPGLVMLTAMRADRAEPEVALEALAGFHACGGIVDWTGVFPGGNRHVELPTYPWQRQTYWVEHRGGPGDAAVPGSTAVTHPLLRAVVEHPDGEGHLFTAQLSLRHAPWIADHQVYETVVFPGTGILELVLAVGQALELTLVSELTLAAPLRVPEHAEVPVQIWVEGPDAQGRRGLALYSRNADAGTDGAWTCHARGQLAPGDRIELPWTPREVWPPARAKSVDLSGLYDSLSAAGLGYGPTFRGLQALWRDDDELYAVVALPEQARQEPESERASGRRPAEAAPYVVHPALLDAALHAIPFLLPASDGVQIPFEWRQVQPGASGATQLRVRLRITEQGDDLSKVALEARDHAGQLVLQIGELVVRRASAAQMQAAVPRRDAPLYQVQWEPVPTAPAEPGDAAPAVVLGGYGALARRLGLPRFVDLASLFESSSRGALPPQILVDATVGAEPGLLAQAHDSSHHGLAVLQDWFAQQPPGASELVWVTQGAIAAMAGDAIEGLGQAALWGLVRAARSEHPDRVIRLLDLEATTTSAQVGAALAVRGEPELAVRGSVVRAARLAVAEPAVASHATRPSLAGATVLITGGTGELGALVARHLVGNHGVRRLVLTSRSGAEAPGARELQAALQQQGAEVVLAACDVSSREALAQLLGEIPAEAPLRAVFHCAGVLDDGAVRSLTAERIDRVFGPKLDAAIHLHQLTRSLPLEAFVLFSSVAGILGTAGQANYAAANTYLDALAAHRRSHGLVGQSLAWGLWEPSGRGMTAKLSRADLTRIQRQGIAPLAIAQGLQLLDEALARPEALLVPAKLALSSLGAGPEAAVLRKLVKATPRRATAAPDTAGTGAALMQRLVGLAPAAQQAALLDVVRTEVAAVFRLASQMVPDDQPLKSLGLDSLMALELRDRLGAKVAAPLPATLAFDHPTPRDLASYLKTAVLKDTVPALPDEETALRRVLATIPLSLLRQHGLLARLLQLADTPEPSSAVPPASALEELSNEELASLVRSL